jgi:hypothetical protein
MARMKFGREPATDAESPITASVDCWAPWAIGGSVFTPPEKPPELPELVPDPVPDPVLKPAPARRRRRSR